jgi:hypothetical protein
VDTGALNELRVLSSFETAVVFLLVSMRQETSH